MNRRRVLKAILSVFGLLLVPAFAFVLRRSSIKNKFVVQISPTIIKGFILADPRIYRMAFAMRYHSDRNETEFSDRQAIDGVPWETQRCKNCHWYKDADEFQFDHAYYSRCGLMPETGYLNANGDHTDFPPEKGSYAETNYIVAAQGYCSEWNLKGSLPS